MASSFEQYLGDGVTRLFQVPFDYLSKAHVTATVNGEAAALTWEGDQAVRLLTAPAANAVVELIRKTPGDTRLVDFVDGSVLTEHDLDLSALQLLFIAQEAADKAARAIGLTASGKYDARGLEIINVGDPTTPRSAVTKGWAEQAVKEAVDTVADKTTFLFVEKADVEPAPGSIPVEAIREFARAVEEATRAAFMAAKAYTEQQRDAVSAALTTTAQRLEDEAIDGDVHTLGAAVAHADAGDAVTLSTASARAGTGDANTLSAAKAYSDAGDANTLSASKAYSDVGDAATLGASKAYSDGTATAAQSAAVQSAKTYTDGQITTARQAAAAGDAETLQAAKAYTDAKPSGEIPRTIARVSRGAIQGNGGSSYLITHNLGAFTHHLGVIDAQNQTILVDSYPVDANTALVELGFPAQTGENYFWTAFG